MATKADAGIGLPFAKTIGALVAMSAIGPKRTSVVAPHMSAFGRSTDPAIHKSRTDHKPQDCQDARDHYPPYAGRTRRRGHRISNPMSAFGPKQTFHFALHMSAFGGKADIAMDDQNR
jgi:hypothetical protein